jgi:hypothetical protein
MTELASIVRATIPSVTLKVSASVTAKRQAKAASKRAFRKNYEANRAKTEALLKPEIERRHEPPAQRRGESS